MTMLRVRHFAKATLPALAFCVFAVSAFLGQEPPAAPTAASSVTPLTTWIDDETGHRVTRLTNEPGSTGLYFNENAYTLGGRVMIYEAAHSLYALDLQTHQSHVLVAGPIDAVVVAKAHPYVYFMRPKDQGLYMADAASGELRKVATLPLRATISTINADETLLAGNYIEGDEANFSQQKLPSGIRPSVAAAMEQRRLAGTPMVIFTVDLQSGQIHQVLRGTDWLNHVLFSPTDPTLLMYCHEGLWENVDRIWTIRTDGTNNTLVHKRTVPMETAGHEFWGQDGHTIWYDLQVPKGGDFYLASYDVRTGDQHRYHMQPNEWSLHFNAGFDPAIFCGDGADEFASSRTDDGKYIELYKLQSGVLARTRLSSMKTNNYKVEPNVRFSPDLKSIIFTSNMLGPTYVFAVQVVPTRPAKQHVTSPVVAGVNTPTATFASVIRLRNSNGVIIPGADITIRTLGDGQTRVRLTSGGDGQTASFQLDGGLHRISVTCPNGECADTHYETFGSDLPKVLELTAEPHTTQPEQAAIKPIVNAQGGQTGSEVNILVRDSNQKPMPNRDVLVRLQDASNERWYKTNASGVAAVDLPASKAIIVVASKRHTFSYRPSAKCSSAAATSSIAPACIEIGSTISIVLPQIL
jgi:oligogalacturonide lyase